MAAQDRHQGDDESVTAGVALADGRVDAAATDARVAELEAALERKHRELEAIVDRYEHLLATRERLRREARAEDGPFVWTDGE